MAEGARSKLPFQGSSLRPQFVLTVCQPPWPLTRVLLSTLSIARGCSLINHRCGEAAVRPQAFVSPGLDSITAVLTCHDLYTENHTHAGCSVITQLPGIWKDHGLQISTAASVPIHGSVKSTFPRGQLQPTLAWFRHTTPMYWPMLLSPCNTHVLQATGCSLWPATIS